MIVTLQCWWNSSGILPFGVFGVSLFHFNIKMIRLRITSNWRGKEKNTKLTSKICDLWGNIKLGKSLLPKYNYYVSCQCEALKMLSSPETLA